MTSRDPSNGYDADATGFMASRSPSIGVETVREWARLLTPGAAILDLGCGHGVPISAALIADGFAVHGIDASPTLVASFRERFPGTPVAVESVEESDFFGRTFDGIVAVGLVFLLDPDGQRDLISRTARALSPGGRFLFSAPRRAGAWDDIRTGRRSVSLGGAAYRRLIANADLDLAGERDDEGGNHYYSAVRPRSFRAPSGDA